MWVQLPPTAGPATPRCQCYKHPYFRFYNLFRIFVLILRELFQQFFLNYENSDTNVSKTKKRMFVKSIPELASIPERDNADSQRAEAGQVD